MRFTPFYFGIIPFFALFSQSSVAQNSNLTPFRQCVIAQTNLAIAQGAPRDMAMFAVKDIFAPDNEIIALSKVQPESKMKIWDYLSFAIDDERALDGQMAYAANRDFLYSIEAITGVDRSTILGIWGMETDYGKIIGKRKIIPALATLGCGNHRRAKFFRTELKEAIRIEAHGHIPHDKFIGSWAGAFGQTQFMPSTFWRLALDGNNDGKKNLIEEKRDALASTANFLQKSGWIRGQAWGFEVITPKNFNGIADRKAKKPISHWRNSGFKRADGKEFPNDGNFGLIFPAGRNGPAFLVGRNFDAVYSYNPAISYALAVNLIADRIKGSKGVYGAWPTNDLGISRAQKREIQAILIRNGYDIGQIDGILGEKAIKAIKDIYIKNNWHFDGRIGQMAYQKITKTAK